MLKDPRPAPPDPAALALQVLGWVLADDARVDRFLALTGITPDGLREGLGDPAIQGAVLDYLLGHEADLLSAAEALGHPPETFGRARHQLENER